MGHNQEKTAAMGQRLRLYIRAQGLNLREFERQSGVPYKTLQQYLSGRRYPGGEHLAKMAEIGIDTNWLLTGKMLGELWFSFPDMEPVPEVLGAFPYFHEIFLYESIKIIDEVSAELIKKSGLQLPIAALVKSVWVAYSAFGKALEGHQDKVVELVGIGWPHEKIADLFIPPMRSFLKERLRLIQDDYLASRTAADPSIGS